tara:strand:- start:187 stop:1179 length:993 start_codon:yes stop_codon:yes gene_type:complete
MTQRELPKRWRTITGRKGFYYIVPKQVAHLWDNKQTFKLGDTEAEAWRTWFSRTGGSDEVEKVTVSIMLDQFLREYVAKHLADDTYEAYKHHCKPLKRVFGKLHPTDIKPVQVYKYLDKRPRVAGNREASVLSSALTFAIEKGWVEHNTIRGNINRRGDRREEPRRRSPSLEELLAFCDLNPHLRGYVTLKRITGLRQGQLLALNLTEHWDGTYLHPNISKGGNDTRYHGLGLETAIKSIVGPRRVPKGPLFLNRHGRPMTSTGLKSAWRRAMQKYVDQGGERFNEHDIRKYVADAADTLQHAQQLLGHTSAKVTAAVYRQRPQDVEVLE